MDFVKGKVKISKINERIEQLVGILYKDFIYSVLSSLLSMGIFILREKGKREHFSIKLVSQFN